MYATREEEGEEVCLSLLVFLYFSPVLLNRADFRCHVTSKLDSDWFISFFR